MIKLKGFLFSGASAVLFGLVPYFSKTLMDKGYDSEIILAYRYLIAALIYIAYVLIRRVDVRISWASLVDILVVGTVFMAPTAYFFLLSFDYIPTGVATSVNYLYPVLVALLMTWFYDQKLSASVWVGILLAVAGVALLSYISATVRLLGLTYAFLSAFTYAGYLVYLNRPRLRTVPARVLTFYFLVLGGAGFTLFSALSGNMRLIMEPAFLFNTSMLAVFSTIIGSLLMLKGFLLIGAVPTSVLGTLEPLTAVLVGIFYFGEEMTLANDIGFILVLVAVLLVINGRSAGRLKTVHEI